MKVFNFNINIFPKINYLLVPFVIKIVNLKLNDIPIHFNDFDFNISLSSQKLNCLPSNEIIPTYEMQPLKITNNYSSLKFIFKVKIMNYKNFVLKFPKILTKSIKPSVEEIKIKRRDELIWNFPIIREKIKLKNIPFILLSDYVSKLAKENNLSIKDVEIIAIFDNIPLHRAIKTYFDNDKLYFYLRRENKGAKKWIRLIYGKSKSSDKIIYTSASIR